MEKKKLPKGMKPLGKDKEYDAEVRAKLKGSCSKKREFAQQVRRAKEKAEQGGGRVDDLTLLISNPNASARQIAEMIQTAGKMDLKPAEFIQLIRVTVEKHKAIFGNKLQLDGQLDINLKVKELELRNDCILRAIEMLLKEAKTAGIYEWQKRFTPEQINAMLENMAKYLAREVIERRIKKNYGMRKGILVMLENGYSYSDMPKEEIDKINEVEFVIPELTPEDETSSAQNLQKIKQEIDEKLEKEKEEKNQEKQEKKEIEEKEEFEEQEEEDEYEDL